MKGNNIGYLVKEGARNLKTNRLMSAASIAVLMSCMLFIGMAVLLSLNLNSILGYVEDQNEVVVFAEDDVDEYDLERIAAEIDKLDNILDVVFISREQALQVQMELLGDAAILLEEFQGEENFLPDAYKIQVDNLSELSDTIRELEAIDGVEKVNANPETAQTVADIKTGVAFVGVLLVGVMGLVSLVIMANTIRMTVFYRRKEISIMKLVGATDLFIKMPFIIEGVIIGLISALIAFAILWIGYAWLLSSPTENISSWMVMALENTIDFQSVALPMLGLFVGSGAGLGIIGSTFFVGRYTKV